MKHCLLLSTCLIMFGLCTLCSCEKFLSEKSDATLSTPSTLDDLQAILDNQSMNSAPSYPNIGTDEYYLTGTRWNSITTDLEKNGYIWAADVQNKANWVLLYQFIFYANTVLDNLDHISSEQNPERWQEIKGAALFFRAWYYYNLCQLYCNSYDASTAKSDLGVPMRLNSNFNIPSVRPTVWDNYQQIIGDLEIAASLLRDNYAYKTRPNKAAAYGLLARTFLICADYNKAAENAKLSLEHYDFLLDYNDITLPFKKYHDEQLFYASHSSPITLYYALMDSVLYDSYDENDVRKSLLFKPNTDGSVVFAGNYNGASLGGQLFCGIAVDEIYLIEAEANARIGKMEQAMSRLNLLKQKRYRRIGFIPFQAASAVEALDIILSERKKELLLRGIRWSDIRRLNKIGANITLTRNLDNEQFSLPPNDLRATLLIPDEIISLSGIEQNPR